ncbi:MAG: VPLPA-CTERM sorting domain-containing protein [Paracoccaceae bacterium]
MRLSSAIAGTATLAMIAALSPARAGIIDGSTYSLDTQIVNLQVLGVGVDVSRNDTGQATPANGADPLDIALAQAALGVDLTVGATDVGVDLDLGVLGSEWTAPDVFDLVIDLDLDGTITPANALLQPLLDTLLSDPATATAAPTIDWVLSDLDLENGEIITSVTQINDASLPVPDISFTDDTITINYDNLVGLQAALFSDADFRPSFMITTAVPLPASAWLLAAGVAGLWTRHRFARG